MEWFSMPCGPAESHLNVSFTPTYPVVVVVFFFIPVTVQVFGGCIINVGYNINFKFTLQGIIRQLLMILHRLPS